MAKNLGLGSKLIRVSLIIGTGIAAIGGFCSAMLGTVIGTEPTARGYLGVITGAQFLNAALFLFVLWMLASRKLVTRVNTLANAMDRGAEGDLTVTIESSSEDELGHLTDNLNAMFVRLAGAVNKVKGSVDELRSIAATVQDVADKGVGTARIQAQAVQGTTDGMRDIDRSVNEVAEAVESLSRTASENAASIIQMSASIEEVAEHMEALARAVEDVSSSIVQMATAEKEIGRSVGTLRGDSARTASLVADMDIAIKQIEKSALETAAISEEVLRDAELGRESVESTISGIDEIRRSSHSVAETIETLSHRVGDINTIVSVINDIAEQTKLLALNASIIAAQAGEHGKGFAVVANEIKELARRTTSSTGEIGTIIMGLREETELAVKAIRQAEKRISEGEQLSYRSGEALHKIVDGVKMATSQAGEIARTTVEQAQGSEHMRQAMERVAEMVEQIVRATNEQANGTEMIMGAVARMKDLTGQVFASTHEQRTTSTIIVKSSEGITTMISNIRQACQVQTESSTKIIQAVENMENTTESNLETTHIMGEAVAGLAHQTDALSAAMGGFRV